MTVIRPEKAVAVWNCKAHAGKGIPISTIFNS